MSTNDPANIGTTGMFDQTNFPGSSTQNRTDAAAMYAVLTGRISDINRSVALSEQGKYEHGPSVDRNHMREMALYFQDSWRWKPNLTVNY